MTRIFGIYEETEHRDFGPDPMEYTDLFCKSCFERKVTPVMFDSGRLMLETRPSSIGSPPMLNTIGMLAVAALAALAEGPPIAAIKATF